MFKRQKSLRLIITAIALVALTAFTFALTTGTFNFGTAPTAAKTETAKSLTAGVCDTAGPIEVESSGGTAAGTPTAYATLGGAFTAINGGIIHTGVITIDVCGDTNEAAVVATLQAGNDAGTADYTSITMSPAGGAARTITGAPAGGSPMIDFSGADNVTINGLNTGGNSLTISNTTVSATSGTATIRFIGGATTNTITNSNIQGSGTMSVATNGAVIFFSTDAVTTAGNDNNTISNNNIGPAGANLPTKAILGNGSTTTTAIGNSGIIIDNNNIFDYFGAAVTSSGIATNGGCNTWTITNNRFYQTGTRTWTTGSLHVGIDLRPSTATSGAQGHTVTGNIIGYASNTQTGVYTLTGAGTGAKFIGILHNGISTGTTSNINNNTVAAVSMTGVTGSGTSTSSPFTGILFQEGNGITNGNTIGSQSATGSLTFSTTTTSSTDVYGIYNFSSNAWTSNTNNVGGISVTNLGASGTFLVYGMRAFTASTTTWTATSNNVGGTIANSIQLTGTGTSSQVVGMFTSNCPLLLTSNTIRNLTSNIGTGTGTTASVAGILNSSTTPNSTLSQNTIFNLSNTNATTASVVTGIQFTGSTANVVERNFIHSLTVSTNSATAEVNGIRVGGGTTVYRNNMIAIGAGIANAIGGATANGISGINEPAAGTDSFFHNSVYIGGSPTAGTGSSWAFNSTQTTNTRSYRDNIFFNARSNSGATGKNYAVRVGGTTPNPAGLTINNNVYFANGSGAVFGFFNSLDVANLAAWKTAVGQDAGSFEANPQYNDPTNAIPDLHLHPTNATVAEGNGVDVGVTNDFDGQTRASFTPVDIGADAGNFVGVDLSAPNITYTTFLNTSSTANRVLSVAITDVTGVAGGANSPRIYFKKSTDGSYVSTQCVMTGGTSTNGTWDCTINYALVGGGSVTVGDTIQYFVVAQDTVGNLASNPSSGFTGTDVNTVTTPPTTPSQYTIVNAISGSFNVGTAETYTSLTNTPGGLFEFINNNEVSGNITINITSDLTGETGAVALNEFTSPHTILIKPSGAARSVTGASTVSLIKLSGADRVRIDGSTAASLFDDVVGGTPSLRELTINNTGTGAVIWIATNATGGATNNTVRNTILNGVGSFGGQGIIAGSGTTFGAAAENGRANSNNTIQNNRIARVQNAVFTSGDATTRDQNWSITENDFGSATVADKLSFRGALISGAENFTFSQNNISGVNSSTGTSSTMSGIQLAGVISGGAITRNQIKDIRQNNTTGWGSNGIYLTTTSTASNVTIANNFISDIASQGFNGNEPADNGYGIVLEGTGGGFNIYHNTVVMNTNQVAAASITAALLVDDSATTAGALNVRNNIFANTQTVGTQYGVFVDTPITNTVFSAINYNDYFAVDHVGRLGGTDRTTLGDWQTATGQDGNSQAVDPVFVSTTDFHLNAVTTPLLGDGITGLATVDFDNDPRPGTVSPDIGADEIVEAEAGVIPAGTYYNADFGSGSIETLAGDVTITNSLHLTGGQVNTGAFTLTLGCNATYTLGGGDPYVIGNFRKEFCTTGSFTFPVGTTPDGSLAGFPAEYSPFTANVTALGTNPSSLMVSVSDAFIAGANNTHTASRFWSVTEVGDITADISFTYLNQDVNGVETTYQVLRREAGTTATYPGGSVNDGTNTASAPNVTNFSQWAAGNLAPTAANVNVGGRVTNASGTQGLPRVRVVLSGGDLPQPVERMTNPFGYYSFENLTVGQTYVITVGSKQYTFSVPSRVITPDDNISDIDFFADWQ